MINLKMKLIKQETSRSCGVACIRMILDYYGLQVSEQQIFDFFQPNENRFKETNLFSLGNFALKQNFDVRYIGYNPMIFSNLKITDLKTALAGKIKINYNAGKWCCEEALKFIEAKGELVKKIPVLRDINLLLDKKIPVIVGVRPVFLRMRGKLSMNHFIIIKGYDGDRYYILDPAHGELKIDSATLLTAIYARMPEMLIISKPKKVKSRAKSKMLC